MSQPLRCSLGTQNELGRQEAVVLCHGRLGSIHDVAHELRPIGQCNLLAIDRTVLYVEDNLSNVKLIERLMARYPNVKLLTAMQAQLGLDLAHEHRPDLILLDLHLPDLSGLDVLRHLKGDPETATIPVVMLSADAMERQIERLLEAGALAYLSKPLDIRKFLTIVDEILSYKSA